MDKKPAKANLKPAKGQFPPDEYLEIDPKFIFEVATGLEDLEEIAPRYGFKGVQIEALKLYEPFNLEVAKVRAELFRTGKTFKLKAGLMAEQVMNRLFEDAVQQDSSSSLKLDTLKLLSKLADLEPKASANVNQGSGFSITINVGGASKPADVIEVKAE